MTEDTIEPGRAAGVRTITSAYIYNREFRRAIFGGYVTREVDEFLTRAGDAFEAGAARTRALEQQVREQQERLEAYQRSEETLRNTLVAAQKFGEDTVAAAQREAAALVEEARLVKEQAASEAARLVAEIMRDTDKLERQRSLLLVELRTMLETHLGLVNSLTRDRDRLSAASAGGGDNGEGRPTQAANAPSVGSREVDGEDAAEVRGARGDNRP